MIKKPSKPLDGDIIGPDDEVFEAEEQIGRPEHVPTERDRTTAEVLSGFGMSHLDIATKIGISAPTLRKHYRRELSIGDVNFKAKNLLQAERLPSEKLLMFFLKTRLGLVAING